jgi:hypothetical protein
MDKIEIRQNFKQDREKAEKNKKVFEKILKPLQERGLIKFKAKIYRKCDYCEREIKQNERYKTIGNKDKCYRCLKAK